MRTNAICDLLFGRHHHLHFPLPAAHAADLRFLFCGRRGAERPKDPHRLAGTVGGFLRAHQTAVNLVSGLVVIFFGLSYLGVFQVSLFRGSNRAVKTGAVGFFPALLLGVVFSVGWTPCVGAFLGSALMLASQQGHVLEGVLMLLAYSLGLGIPFLLSAVLIDYLKFAFQWIKQHYRIINTACGVLLVLLGVLMATGTMGQLLALIG